jgi:hypothetical protein
MQSKGNAKQSGQFESEVKRHLDWFLDAGVQDFDLLVSDRDN